MLIGTGIFAAAVCCQLTTAQEAGTVRPWKYLLLDDSRLLDDCPVCGRPSIPEPMHGTFELRPVQSNPLFTTYALENIEFKAGRNRSYSVKGSGTFQTGGEVALTQQMTLQVDIDDGTAVKACGLKSGVSPVSRFWPMMDITAEQTNGTITQTYSLRLAAAPVRDLWFSTSSSFTAGSGPEAGFAVSSGDLISQSGRVVKRSAELYAAFGAPPPAAGPGLDAVDIQPGGVIAFSLDHNLPGSPSGPLQHGDLLSSKGSILIRNQQLLAPFILQPPAPDTGLDVIHTTSEGINLFSIGTNVFSEKLGVMLHRGDLLSSRGTVLLTNQGLLSAFKPSRPEADYGLDALYVWGGGEIWFSTEEGFVDNALGPVAAGDLLSNSGYIVLRNGDLLSAFAPVNAAGDPGLDALYVITDAAAPLPPADFTILSFPSTQSIHLSWLGSGRVFQVEQSSHPGGPFEVLSPLIPDLSFEDTGVLSVHGRRFYRLLQW